MHGGNLQPMLLDALVKELEIKGSLNVLRHGFKFYGKLFRLAYFKPAHALSPDVLALYGQNQLTLIRQVPCHPGDHSTVDMVLAVNGLPVATIELKNPGTHQTWRHAVKQYQGDRDPRAPLFDFKKRALVANPLDKFQLGVRKLIEDLMIQRMAENDKIVTRYMDDGEFQRTAFPILSKEIFEAVHAQQNPAGGNAP